MAGIVKRISGHFRPYFFAKIPTNIELKNMPANFEDVIHVACSAVILPNDKIDSSEVSEKIAGLDQPLIMPTWNPNNDTIRILKFDSDEKNRIRRISDEDAEQQKKIKWINQRYESGNEKFAILIIVIF